MMLRIVCIENDPSIRVAVEGPLTSDNITGSPEQLLSGLLGAGWAGHRILMDLSKSDHIDSSAIGWLLDCHKAMEKAGGSITLHSVQPTVLRILKILKIDSLIPIETDEQAAMQSAVLIARTAA